MSSKTFNLIGGSSSGIKLVSISIINPPDKVNYKPGEIFDPAGMQIQAVYSNGATVIATGWTFVPDNPLSEETTSITILYSEGGITVQTQQVITVTKKILQIPSQNGTLIYTGNIQYPSWNNYDDSEILLTGTTSSLNAGTYIAQFSLKDTIGTQWSDGSINTKEISWSIERATILTIPSQSGILTYNGFTQSPSWNEYDPIKMTISGITSSINAGIYSAGFTPTDNYKWNDETITIKNINWTINKAAGSLNLSTTNVSLDMNTKSKTVTVTRVGDGVITATSNATDIATVSINGTTLTITGKASGSAIITVKVAEGTNHNAPTNKTISVNVQFVILPDKQSLNNTSWEDIKIVTDAGQAANYWSVGDRKAVTLNGTCSKLTFSNQTYYVYILGFDHNSSREGANRIHFQFGYTSLSGGVHIAFISGFKDDSDFYMNATNTNSGGWSDSFMRNTVCATFQNCLPSNLRSVLKTVTKYSDNSGNGSDIPSSVRGTTDTIFLLSEFELYGVRRYANSSEQNYQTQYQYYKNGNSKQRFKHTSTNDGVIWRLRSVYSSDSKSFCAVSNTEGAFVDYFDAELSFGFAPAFCV